MQEYVFLGGHYCFEDFLPHRDLYNVIYTPQIGTKNNNTAVHCHCKMIPLAWVLTWREIYGGVLGPIRAVYR